MAHTYNKIESADLANKGNVGMPDTPNLTTEEMQQKLDELPNLIIEKFNSLIDELNEYVGSAIISTQFNALRFNEDNELQFSTDGGVTWQSSSSIIQVNVSPEDIHMDNYSISSSAERIKRTDSLKTAVGKLEGRVENLGDSLPNLIPYPYFDGTRTAYGITFTVDKTDGSITANGTATADAWFGLINSSENMKLPFGNYYYCGCPSGGGNSTYYLEFSRHDGGTSVSGGRDTGSGKVIGHSSQQSDMVISMGILIKSGVTVNNLVFRPMLVTGTNAPTKYRKFVNPEVFLTQEEYDALPTKDKRTVYNTY